MPSTSIVILTYNGLEETTKPCLESVLSNTPPDAYELVLVDNASTDGTVDYLKGFAAKHGHVTLCLNDTNKGFAGGNNDGMRLAAGEYVVLLNNDTLLPPGWLECLLRLLKENDDLGLVGPVTNSAGNEQRIDIAGLTEVNFEAVAAAYTRRQKNVWFQTEKLGFFCMAMRRSLLDEIGYLDERFGIGMFEDDDYCLRVRKAGYKLAVAEDCFVFHKGSVSFKKLATDTYIELFSRNRTFYFEKHDVLWAYSDISKATWARLKADIAELAKVHSPVAERLCCRLALMDDTLTQVHQVEVQNANIGGQEFAERIVAQKHRQLMEISDWATQLKSQNDEMAHQLARIKSSFAYRLFGRFLHYGPS
jgi:GT2 family glycosyltransferase